MLKMRAPQNSTGLNVGGRSIDVGEDGSAQVHPADVVAATAHGFTPWTDVTVQTDPDKMTREELIEHHVAAVRQQISRCSDDELRSRAKKSVEDDDGHETQRRQVPPAQPGPLSADEAQSLRFKLPDMPRAEMQAFLKNRSVAFGPATGDEKLREMVSAEITRSTVAPE